MEKYKRETYDIGYAIDENGNKRPLTRKEKDVHKRMLDKMFETVPTLPQNDGER